MTTEDTNKDPRQNPPNESDANKDSMGTKGEGAPASVGKSTTDDETNIGKTVEFSSDESVDPSTDKKTDRSNIGKNVKGDVHTGPSGTVVEGVHGGFDDKGTAEFDESDAALSIETEDSSGDRAKGPTGTIVEHSSAKSESGFEDPVDIEGTIEFDPDQSAGSIEVDEPVRPDAFGPMGTVVERAGAAADPDVVSGFDSDATMEFDPDESAGTISVEGVLSENEASDKDDVRTVNEQDGRTVEMQTVEFEGEGRGSDFPTMEFDTSVESAVHDSEEFKETLDPDSLLNGSNITQTLDPRSLSESDQRILGMTTDFEVADDQRKKKRPIVKPEDITESRVNVPTRQLAGIDSDLDLGSDYELIEVLGEGGMGTVYLAKQTSLDRMVALKMVRPLASDKAERLRSTGKLSATEKNRRDQFLAEAIVTGDLDHPNIVPIHDLAIASNNALFYAMKKVDGTPWSSVIQDKSLDENLEILLKVCDAMGFAHARGIVHRDIKPENVMLGEYGVVMLMDWGLAIPKPDYAKRGTIQKSTSLGGSPAYMAPEMATGPIEEIGPPSDIYLLGAVLFEIITGRPPHIGNNLTQCLRAAATNEIVAVSSKYDGELMQIARKAMASKPKRRYVDVSRMQKAIREYRSHAESIMMTVRADNDMRMAEETNEYTDYARSLFGYEEALTLWPGNEVAKNGEAQARIAYASAAYGKEDYDLGLSLLDEKEPEHQALIGNLRDGQSERDSRQTRLTMAKRVAACLLGIVLIGGTGAFFKIQYEKGIAEENAVQAQTNARIAEANKEEAEASAVQAKRSQAAAEFQQGLAEQNAKNAEKARMMADQNKKVAERNAEEARLNAERAEANRKLADASAREAVKNENIARQNAIEAQKQRKLAVQKAEEAQRERMKAEYEAYVAQIGLAKARIEENEFDDARRILQELKATAPEGQALGWEWQWLWQQANQSSSDESLTSAGRDLAMNASASRAVVTLDDGTAQLFQVSSTGELSADPRGNIPETREVTCSAVSPNEEVVAVAGADGNIRLWKTDSMERLGILRGHTGYVTDLVFVDEMRLISTSEDRTARLWDWEQEKELAVCWHIAAVKDAEVSTSGREVRLLTAVADERSGRAVLWDLRESGSEFSFERAGDFLGHSSPVFAVSLSHSGQLAASGDRAGRVLLWSPADVKPIDYGSQLVSAVKSLSENTSIEPESIAQTQRELSGARSSSAMRLTSTTGTFDFNAAHDDAVESIQFNADGSELMTTSDDYTIKLWDVQSGALRRTLRGHGGWVRDAMFFPGNDQMILSAGNDSAVRSWESAKYRDVVSMQPSLKLRGKQAHDDEIWSAAFNATGDKIVTASRDHTARIVEIDRESLAFLGTIDLIDEDESLQEGSSFVALSLVVDSVRKRLFVGSADAEVRVWDVSKGTEISSCRGTGLNTTLAVSPNGKFLVTGSSNKDARVLVWGIDAAGEVSAQPIFRLGEHKSTVTAIAISHDSKYIFTGDRNGMGLLWNSETGTVVGEPLNQHRGFRINSAAFTHESGELLIASDDRKVSRVQVDSRRLLDSLPHQGFVTNLAISTDDAFAVSLTEASNAGRLTSTVTLWDLNRGTQTVIDQAVESSKKEVGRQRVSERIVSARFSGNGNSLVTSLNRDGVAIIKVWDLGAKSPVVGQMLQMPQSLSKVVDAVPAGDGRLLTLNGDSTFLWDLSSKSHVRSFRSHGGITEASFSHDGKYVVTGSRSIKIWDAATGKSLRKIEVPHEGSVRTVQFRPGGDDYVFASAGDDGNCRLWQWNPKTSDVKPLKTFKAADMEGAIQRVRFSPDSKHLLAVGDDGVARAWEIATDKMLVYRDPGSTQRLLCGAFSADGKWIVAGGVDRKAYIWAVDPNKNETTASVVTMQGHADQIEDVGFLGTDTRQLRVMTASRDKSARIWDPRLLNPNGEGREILSLRKHSLGVTSIDATDDGRLLMTAGRDGSVFLWPAGG